MYDELIKALRHCAECDHQGCAADCRFGKEHPLNFICIEYLQREAADAIEDLENRLNLWRQDKIRKWIPVTERLPEEGVSVQVCFHSQGGMAQAVSERFVDNRNQSYWSGLCGMKPTHWMPLPEPPTEMEP